MVTATAILLAMSGQALAADKVTLRFATFLPPNPYVKSLFENYMDLAVADSEGTLDYKMYYNGALGRNPAEALAIVQNGIADIGYAIPAFFPSEAFEDFSIAELPIVGDAHKASVGLWNAIEKGGLADKMEGVKLLTGYASGPDHWHFQKPMKSVSEMAGRKMQASGPLASAMITSMGATPVSVNQMLVPESIANGVVEASTLQWGAMIGSRQYEVTNYHVEYPLGYVPGLIIINNKTWGKLSEAAKAALIKHGGAAYADSAGKGTEVNSKATKAKIMDFGGHFLITPTDEERATLDKIANQLADEWVAAKDSRKALFEAYMEGVNSVK